MNKETTVETQKILVCPQGCRGGMFYQTGKVVASQELDKKGVRQELNTYDFIPDGEVRCRTCDCVAIEKSQKITTTVVEE